MKYTTWIFRRRSRKVHDGIIRHNRTKRAALKNPKRIPVTLNPIFLLFKTVRYAAWMWIPSQSKSRLRCHPCPSHGSGGGFERYDESEEESPTLQLLNGKRRKQRFFIHISGLRTLFGALESRREITFWTNRAFRRAACPPAGISSGSYCRKGQVSENLRLTIVIAEKKGIKARKNW